MSKERRVIGKGGEYKVHPTKTTFREARVYKTPRLFNVITLHYFLGGVETVKREIREFEDMVEGKEGIKVARTKVYKFGKGHILSQQQIIEDSPVLDIREHLVNQEVGDLVLEYDSRPSNFISQNGVVYLIDVTKGPPARLARKIGGPKLERMGLRTNIQVKKVARKLIGRKNSRG